MSQQDMSMEDLVKELLSNDITREEWRKIGEYVEKIRKEDSTTSPPPEPIKRIVYEDGAGLSSNNGSYLVAYWDGRLSVVKDEKVFEDAKINVGVKDLAWMFQEVVKHHEEKYKTLYAATRECGENCKPESKKQFITLRDKKAFVAGLVCGKGRIG